VLFRPFIAIAILIKLDTPGPVFFHQIRVGRCGKTFKMLKFRTMTKDAASTGPSITVGGDARITRIGSKLRATKLDELPQLINVLLGHMSVVGPRPEVPEYMSCYPNYAREVILSVRPGITDPASVAFINEEGILAAADDPLSHYRDVIIPLKAELYLQGIRSSSLVSDLKIILATLRRVIMRSTERERLP